MNTADLIAQLQTITRDFDAAVADAEKWRSLRESMAALGYGPEVTPEQVAHLVPSAELVASVVAQSQKPKRGGRSKAGAVTRAGQGAQAGAAPGDPEAGA